jgi:hypothetical protein
MRNFESDLSSGGEAPIGVILIVFVSVSVDSNLLPVFFLILKLFPDVSDPLE